MLREAPVFSFGHGSCAPRGFIWWSTRLQGAGAGGSAHPVAEAWVEGTQRAVSVLSVPYAVPGLASRPQVEVAAPSIPTKAYPHEREEPAQHGVEARS